MTSGIQSKDVDLDSIFDPYLAGTTKARTAGINVAGSDTSNRYANIIYGSAAAATGIASESADLNTLYAAKGTANYPLPINGANFIAHSSGVVSPSMDSNINVQIKSDGTYSVTVAGNASGNTPSTSGTWLPSGASVSNYQVEFVWTQSSQYPTGPATVTNSASAYQNCTANQSIVFDAQVGQHTGGDQGSAGNMQINLKYMPNGRITTTTFGIDIESQGSA
ncbi:MAG TPA: hypothetical protein VJ823_08980 [Rhodanobacteraceae bacterium]|nr:hypothetical protein [Rhodanobacteraceae bacterium]